MSDAGEDAAGRGEASEDRSSSSSFEDLATAELEEARREAAAEELKDSKPTQTKEAEDEWQDVLGSGVILKKVVARGADTGEDAERPQRGDLCRVSYTLSARDADGGAAHLVERRDNVNIYLGDNEGSNTVLKMLPSCRSKLSMRANDYAHYTTVLQGLDLALSLMYKGERCELQMAPRFGYGERGLRRGDALGAAGGDGGDDAYDGPPLAGDAWLHADLHLHDWSEEPEHETMTYAERMEVGGRRRARGNWWYERGEAALAVQLYRRALDVLDESTGGISDPTPSGEPVHASAALQALLQERVRVHNNMAAAQLKAGAYDAALQAVSHVLACEPHNPKALFRKARVLSAMGRGEEALAAARAAAAAEPDDPVVRREVARCEARAGRDRSAERRLARRMLGAAAGPAAADPKKPSRTKVLLWGSLILSLMVGVASVLVYRYRTQAQ